MAPDQLHGYVPDALEIVCKSFPPDYPENLRGSLAEGAFRKGKVIAAAA